MNWLLIIKSLIVLGGLGLLLSIVLLIAHLNFAVKVDEREAEIRSILPGANCGACGYPGCDGYAHAIVSGKAPLNACTVSGAAVATKIGRIMGQDVPSVEPQVAVLICRGGKNEATERFEYYGTEECRQAVLLLGGPKACIYGCIGMGHCVQVCPVQAIKMEENRLPVIDEKKCLGCGKCVRECPKGTWRLIPRPKLVYLACVSQDRSKAVKDVCKVGCIACGLCVKVCPVGALKMEGNLPAMDFEKCIDCAICVHKCPTKSFIDRAPGRPRASINPRCNGCGACVKVCQFKAIEGEPDKQHKVGPEKCVGCGQCALVCPVKAIDFVGALGYALKTT